ncbi:helix-turn-helix domain-containing protein [Actinorugispora endophytica]|uniref:Helix-turn-helix protein n=1 Tax=Actinorugispora endophytica TaxID=1605990 RepID=A0A4R6V393_9ACTN|nr:helix-turn-helix transcriptional regulator [Actinorugispora endophytica]TDQ54432.1 helix-turn-helix protein [Actinorugispora endophytica]
MSTSPTVAQWQLARELQKLREQRAPLTVTDVAKILEVTVSTVSRWEAAQRVPREKELRQLAKHYGLPAQEAEALLQLRRQAGKRGWWQSYDLEQRYGTFIGLEASATEIEAYASTMVTGLLQTERYARAIITGVNSTIASDDLERQMEVRRERINQAFSEDGPDLWVIMGETATRQQVGGAEVMRDQITHLQELSTHPKVTLQVIPYIAGAHIGMLIPTFMILKLPKSGLSTVYMEGYRSNLFLDSPQDLANHEAIFNQLRLVGIGGDMLRNLLSGIRKEF